MYFYIYIIDFICIFIYGVQLYVSISIPLRTKKFRFSYLCPLQTSSDLHIDWKMYTIIHKNRRFSIQIIWALLRGSRLLSI